MNQTIENQAAPMIDDLLGDKNGRYFGAGFKKTKYNTTQLEFDFTQGTAEGVVSIEYPATWSSKNNKARKNEAHLSSIDSVLLAVRLCDTYLNQRFCLDVAQRNRTWARSLTLKAGSDPAFNLQNIPVTLACLSTEEMPQMLCDQVSTFEVHIGPIVVHLAMDHCVSGTQAAFQGQSVDEFTSLEPFHYYGDHFRKLHRELKDIHLDLGTNQAQTKIESYYHPSYLPTVGAGAGYPFAFSMIDLIVIGSQLAQVLLYQLDNLSRSQSNNLWMRKISIDYAKPLVSANGDVANVKLERERKLQRGDTVWRLCDAKLSFFENPNVQIVGELVHILPQNTLETS